MKKIAVLGAGVIGSIVGGYLARAGGDLTFIDINKGHMDAINAKGLTLHDMDDNIDIEIPGIKAVTSTEGLDVMDIIVVLVKGNFTETALSASRNIIGPDTYLVSFQNGIGNDVLLEEFADDSHIMLGNMMVSGALLQPGTVSVSKSSAAADGTHASMYPLKPNEENVETARLIKEMLYAGGGMTVKLSEHIQTSIWNKALLNIGCNPVCGLIRCNIGYTFNDPDAQFVMKALVRECIAVSDALGVPGVTYEGWYKAQSEHVKTQAFYHYPSTAQDLLKRKVPTEIGTLCGSIVAYGKKLGIPTPVNETIYHLVLACEHNYEHQYKDEP
jgi:2-dehydropantoate 2-reductase